MGAVTRPRGPLPKRVYWFRRLLVLGVAGLLVVGIATLLRPSGGSGADRATTVAAEPASPAGAPTSAATSPSAAGPLPEQPLFPAGAGGKTPLPQPVGPCAPSDVLVTPVVRDASVNQPIKVVLELTTRASPACTWRVTPDSVFVTISRADGPLWSSQQCPAVMPTRNVVPRLAKPDKVRLWWNGKESDPGCTAATDWAMPGRYTVTSVARGSVQPVETDFVLGRAEQPTLTVAPTPTPSSASPAPSDASSNVSPSPSPTRSTASPAPGATKRSRSAG